MSFFDRFRRRKELDPKLKAAYEMGQTFGEHLGQKLNFFVDGRMASVSVGFLEIFKSSLDNLTEMPGHRPQDVAAAELRIFGEKIEEAHKKMWAELIEYFSDEIPIAEAAGMSETLADLIEKATDDQVQFLIAAAKSLYNIKIEALDNAEKT